MELTMELVPCDYQYWEFVRQLRNDPKVRDGFLDDTYITKEMQTEYMFYNSWQYRIALVNGYAAGYVGIIGGDIRVCTHPDYQQQGVGKFMIERSSGVFSWSDPKYPIARVKVNNKASVKLFESCGFEKTMYIMEMKTRKK